MARRNSEPESRLKANYHCAKCRSTNCAVHHVSIPTSVLPLPVGRYLATTCALCGYTEFYDQAVFESLQESDKNGIPASDTDTAT